MSKDEIDIPVLLVSKPSSELATRIVAKALADRPLRLHNILTELGLLNPIYLIVAASLILSFGIYLSWPHPNPPEAQSAPEAEELEFILGI